MARDGEKQAKQRVLRRQENENMMNHFIPEGVSDLNYDEFEKMKAVEESLLSVFRENGYRQIMTPTFEYYDLFADDSIFAGTEDMYKLVDKNGQLMVLRPDATIPIARMAATPYKDSDAQMKLMYVTNVFRTADFRKGEKREFTQAGIEFFGSDCADADAGVIETAISALKKTAGDDMKTEIGDAGYFNGLLEALSVCPGFDSRDVQSEVRKLVESKNIPGLHLFAKEHQIPQDIREALLSLPLLFGAPEETLAKAERLTLNDTMRAAVANVREIYGRIGEKDCVSIDMGLINTLEYYSGMIFQVYLKKTGVIVGSGGRYDKLMKKFGRDIPAVGFGLNVNTLMEAQATMESERGSDVLTIALGKGRLADITFQKFEEAGIHFPDYSKESRKLIFDDETGRFRIIFVKAVDVGIYVEKGACDVGVIGKDTLLESGSDVFEMMDLGYGKCIFAVAGLKGFRYDPKKKLRVASKYPNVAKNYFAKFGRSIEVTKINGSVELAPIVGLSDVIVDIVETGNTLRENGLEVIEKIADISARFIVNRASLKTKQDSVAEIVRALEQ